MANPICLRISLQCIQAMWFFFTADKSSEEINVRNFCAELDSVLHAGEYLLSLTKWQEVYSFLRDRDLDKRLVIIIDEFTYLLHADKAYDSKLQNAIDRILKFKNIFLILCGSEVSVIEGLIDNAAKPLYGRKTADLKLEPFTYHQARAFFPGYNPREAMECYAVLGGIPYYLSLFDDKKTLRENIIQHCFMPTGVLYNEPDTLLRMELVEPYFYKNILLAIQAGACSLNEIKIKVGGESAKISKYLHVLIDLGLVTREIPCGAKANTRNTLYRISDNYFSFYFTFIYRNLDRLNGLIAPDLFYEQECSKEKMNDFIGHRFEEICKEYLKEQFSSGKMPFFAREIGRWWGTNPMLKQPDEIDILALDATNALLAECKYTQKQFDVKELMDLEASTNCIKRSHYYYFIFSKNGVNNEVSEKIRADKRYRIVTIEEMYT